MLTDGEIESLLSSNYIGPKQYLCMIQSWILENGLGEYLIMAGRRYFLHHCNTRPTDISGLSLSAVNTLTRRCTLQYQQLLKVFEDETPFSETHWMSYPGIIQALCYHPQFEVSRYSFVSVKVLTMIGDISLLEHLANRNLLDWNYLGHICPCLAVLHNQLGSLQFWFRYLDYSFAHEPLRLATQMNQKPMVDYLLSLNMNVDSGRHSAMYSAVYFQRIEIMEALLERVLYIKKCDYDCLLLLASKLGHTAIVSQLVTFDRKCPDGNYKEALQVAIDKNHQDVIKILSSVAVNQFGIRAYLSRI
jgi:ankyrin repeat protein